MKIAVLIAGEFREFAIAHTFWTFLKWPEIDCYFSTWNESIAVPEDCSKSPIIEYITAEMIHEYINPIAIDISVKAESGEINKAGWMINRWKTAISLMIKTQNHYDRVILIRPDIALEYDEDRLRCFIVEMSTDDQDLYGINSGKLDEGFPLRTVGKMSDLMLLGSYNSVIKLMGLPQEELHTDIVDIHSYLAKHCSVIYKRYMNVPIPRQCIVRHNCRGTAPLSFKECRLKAKIWWERVNKGFFSMGDNSWGEVNESRIVPLIHHKTNDLNLWDKLDYVTWKECESSLFWKTADTYERFIKNKADNTKTDITYNEYEIVYRYNSHGFRCPDFGPQEVGEFKGYPTMLIGGCSVTEGIGLPENHIWHSFLRNLLLQHTSLPIANFNTGKGGKSIDAITRYIYFTIEHTELQPDMVYLLLPPIMRQEVIVCNERYEPVIWDFLPAIPLTTITDSSIKLVYENRTRVTNYRQWYHECFRNLLLLKWFLAAKNIPLFFSFWADDFNEATIKSLMATDNMVGTPNIPKELLSHYIPGGISGEQYILPKNRPFKQSIARDHMHFGPNSHFNLANDIHDKLLGNADFNNVLNKWKNNGK